MRIKTKGANVKPWAILLTAGMTIAAVLPARAADRVITIGDSWAYLVADYGSVQLMLDTFFPGQGYTVANESFGGGTAAWMTTVLSDITAKLNAHPTADVVWLSASGNDLLAGQLAGGWYLGMSGESTFFDTVGGYVNTVVQHILNHRSDLQVVIVSYDYLNLWETGDAGLILAANLNILNYLQNGSLNAAFRSHETRKQSIANASRRVHHVWAYGLVNSVVGYSGAFGSLPGQGYYPPDLYPDFPTRPDYMGNDDPIHMNASGYNLLALHAYNNFFNTVFQAAVLHVDTNTIGFGNVRIGTSANGSVTASNTGPNFTKVKALTFPAAGGEFSGGAQTADPLFRDPTLGSDTAGKTYGYAPTDHGSDAQALTITSDSGNAALSLAGTGVGPDLGSSASGLDFGEVESGTQPSLPLEIRNDTTDPDLGNLTGLTLVSAEITGPDAGQFDLEGFAAGTVLAKGESVNLSVEFDASGGIGAKSATLRLQTDQGTALGGSGQAFDFPLTATVAIFHDLTVVVVNDEWGKVLLDPEPADPNAPRYAAGTLVTLTADPNESKVLKYWRIYDPNHPGDANYAVTDSNNPISVLMDGDQQVSAHFTCGSDLAPLLPALVLVVGACGLSARRRRR